jgi:lipopolysaccharide biosynthesis glycosyltransferase
MLPFRIFIGYDEREAIAYHVLCHSILRRATRPVTIAPLRRELLAAAGFTRPRGEHDSTEFAISRFMVPALCGYEGRALFMDCDMLVLDDITTLADFDMRGKPVACVQHAYTPRGERKFLDQRQSRYARKNWSSVILFDTSLCHRLHVNAVNNANVLDLHQFRWLYDDEIAALPARWNNLIGEECELPVPVESSVLHYTRGGPWFKEYDLAGAAYHAWRDEFNHMRGALLTR